MTFLDHNFSCLLFMSVRGYLIGLQDDHIISLDRLVELFLDWNSRLNLSSLRTQQDVEVKHVVDSLLLRDFDLIRSGGMLLDMGTGGGFPGLPLSVVYPKTQVTLVDATQKKVNAVASMARDLGLMNVKCIQGRAEELGRLSTWRERFDVVVARALAGFATLLEYCVPFVKVGGVFIAYQGPEILLEIDQYRGVLGQLGAELEAVERKSLPEGFGERVFVVCRKVQSTPLTFPRAVGIPKKNPLF